MKKKLKKKTHHIQTTADGKQLIMPGKEPLKKEPDLVKALEEKWELLKARINNKKAFLRIIEKEKKPEDLAVEQGMPEAPGVPGMPGEAPIEGQEQVPGVPTEAPIEGQEKVPEGQEDERVVSLKNQGFTDEEISSILGAGETPEETPEEISEETPENESNIYEKEIQAMEFEEKKLEHKIKMAKFQKELESLESKKK
jgi:hypothetical protein